MAGFHPRADFRRRDVDLIWANAAGCYGLRSPKVLWEELWPKYNRITIPLLDENAFFADAVSIAKVARDRKEAEEMLATKRDQRMDEFHRVLSEIGSAIIYNEHKLEFKAAEGAALKVVQTNSLDSILQFICGSMFGWPNEPADQRKPRPRVNDWIDGKDPYEEEYYRGTQDYRYHFMSSPYFSPFSSWSRSPSPIEHRQMHSGESASNTRDENVFPNTSRSSMERDTNTIDETFPSNPPLTSTTSTILDHDLSRDARSNSMSSELPSADVALDNAVNVESKPLSSVPRQSTGDNTSHGVMADTSEEQIPGAANAAAPPCPKRKRSDEDGGSDAESDEQSRKKSRVTSVAASVDTDD